MHEIDTTEGDPPGGRLAALLPERWRRIAATVPEEGEALFSPQLQRWSRRWVAGTLPIAALAGLFVDGRTSYVVAWVLVAALYTPPAMAAAWMLSERVDPALRGVWRFFGYGVAAVFASGAALLAWVLLPSGIVEVVTVAPVIVSILLFSASLVALMQLRSGLRAVMVDVVESAMLVVGIVALGAPLALGPMLASDSRLYTFTSTLSFIALLSSFFWMQALYRRLGGQPRVAEGLGVVLTAVCTANALAQVAQGTANFTLPGVPLILLQALNFGLLLLIPIHRRKEGPEGLERLPAHAQVRTTGFGSSLVVGLLALLLLETVVVADRVTWAPALFAGTALCQLTLLSCRYWLAEAETRRLNAKMRAAAEERRVLLAEVLRSVDTDRHRVAAQLHQQATASYVAFASYLRGNGAEAAAAHPGAGSMMAVRDELAGQAEAMRQLMLAIAPLDLHTLGNDRLETTLTAYVNSLYGDEERPTLLLQIDPDVEMDWTVETLALRILQEGLRNVRRHAAASTVRVVVGVGEGGVDVEVHDDGRGFAPERLLFTSGIGTMRSFAELCGGELVVESAPGRGTAVRATLRTGPVVARPDRPRRDAVVTSSARAPIPSEAGLPAGRPSLRLVHATTE